MRERSTFTSSIAILVGLAVAGCSELAYSPAPRGTPNTAAANLALVKAGLAKEPSNFLEYLAADYAVLADNLYQVGDSNDADYFARKGIGAEHDIVVVPEQDANWGIPLEAGYGFRTQLQQARARLVAVLDSGARDRAPALAARAQVSYDCFVERMEDDWQKAPTSSCLSEFTTAMNQLAAKPVAAAPPAAPPVPPTPSNMIDVYFDFNKASLSPEGKQIVQQLATQIKATGATTVTVTGKTDLSGPDGYNLSLSRRRAEAVKAELVRDGVAASGIVVRYTGKREPPVPTADGVREPRNRVVEVTMR